MSWMEEAVREWVWNYGADHPDQPWLLCDYDVWYPNPHFVGDRGPHPEDYEYGPNDLMTDTEADAARNTDESYIGEYNDDNEMSFNASDFMDDMPF